MIATFFTKSTPIHYVFAFIYLFGLFLANLNFLPFGLIGITGLVSMSACYLIIPKTNQARDENNNSLFNKLHTLSVSLTLLVLFLNLSVIFIIF